MKRQQDISLFFKVRAEVSVSGENGSSTLPNPSDSSETSVQPKKFKASNHSSDVDVSVGSNNGSSVSQTESFETTVPLERFKATDHPLDIGNFVKPSGSPALPPLTDEKKYEILKSCWTPDRNYAFPKVPHSGRTRAFQLRWLTKWPWLAYSEFHGGGAFCRFCVIFAFNESSGPGKQRCLGALVTTPMGRYKHALRDLDYHQETGYHKDAELDANNFIEWYEHRDEADLRNQLDRGRLQQVLKNRARLIPIIKTVLFRGRRGLALRGHRDHGSVVVEHSAAVENDDGNFRDLLRFRIDAGDKALEEHFISAAKNATYTSPDIQNQIIDSIGKLIRRRIVTEVNAAKYFTVLADETRDVSKIDQMTVCLRYVTPKDDQMILRESFLSFCIVTSKTGAALAQTILQVLRDEGIIVSNMRGQGYDGCSSMKGITNGVQAEVKKTVPQALYFHCASHCLNLALAHSVDNTRIAHTIGTIASICAFMSASPHRVRVLQDSVQSILPESRARRLKPLCTTRWVESHRAYITFKELLLPIVDTLGTIASETGDSGRRADELLSAICKFDFIISLYITERFSALIRPLSVQLQAIDLDIFAALQAIESIEAALKASREDAEDEFKELFAEATAVCTELDINVRIPRLCGRQTHRENQSAVSTEEYFRVSIFLPYLDRLIQEFSSIFQDLRGNVAKLQFLLPKYVERSSFDDLKDILAFYEADLNCSSSEVLGEYRRWKMKWSGVPANDRPTTAIDALNHCCPKNFPKIAILLQIFATLPVTTASAERTFSCLKTLKTYLRSTMGEERLNGLASMRIHPDISVTPEEIIDGLTSAPRRMNLVL